MYFRRSHSGINSYSRRYILAAAHSTRDLSPKLITQPSRLHTSVVRFSLYQQAVLGPCGIPYVNKTGYVELSAHQAIKLSVPGLL